MIYPCDRCEYTTYSKSCLRKHIENKHERVRYYCDQCDYAATTLPALKIHIKI